MSGIRGIIFDLDGTLAGTFPLIVASWNASVGEMTGRVWPRDEVLSRFGQPEPEMIQREMGATRGDAACAAYHAFYEANHERVEVFEGIPEVLRALKRTGVKLGIATGKGALSARITVRELGWQEFFAAVVTGSDTPRQKPAPDMLLLAAKKMQVAPADCVMIGDSPVDVQAGRSAGMTTIAAGWHGVYESELRACRPDFTAARPLDLLPIFSRLIPAFGSPALRSAEA